MHIYVTILSPPSYIYLAMFTSKKLFFHSNQCLQIRISPTTGMLWSYLARHPLLCLKPHCVMTSRSLYINLQQHCLPIQLLLIMSQTCSLPLPQWSLMSQVCPRPLNLLLQTLPVTILFLLLLVMMLQHLILGRHLHNPQEWLSILRIIFKNQ